MAMTAASVKPVRPEDLTRSWIRIPSESSDPVGSDARAPEQPLAEHIAEHCRSSGIEHRLDEAVPGRWNITARLPRPGAPRVLIAGHLDTVSARGMQRPFDAECSGRTLRGRGACDDKGPLAAAFAAVSRILAEGRRPEVDLTLLGTADEESGHAGARAWSQSADDADLVIALEPTGLRRVTAHKGVLRARVTTTGVACHSSRPELGSNAIEAMLGALSGVIAEGKQFETIHDPQLGTPTLQVTVINGGGSINIVPHHCEAKLDLRLVPALSPEEAKSRLQLRCGCATLTEIFSAPALAEQKPKAGMGERFIAALQAVGVERGSMVAPYCTDAAFFQQRGPCLVWGPGRIEDAHTAEECIDLDELEQATEALVRFLS